MTASSTSRARHLIARAATAFGYKRLIFEEAKNAARSARKPLLNAGCGNAYIEQSDVNMDAAQKRVANFVNGDIQNMWMFHDKQFGAVYASHVLEHVEDPDAALKELHRVADAVFVITPLPFWPSAWLGHGHKWVFWHRKRICKVPALIRKSVNTIFHFYRKRILLPPIIKRLF
jgi:SAM-dependent methyltransferase